MVGSLVYAGQYIIIFNLQDTKIGLEEVGMSGTGQVSTEI